MCCSNNKWHNVSEILPDNNKLIIASGKDTPPYRDGTRRFYYIGMVNKEENGFYWFTFVDNRVDSSSGKSFGQYVDFEKNFHKDMLHFNRLFDKWMYLDTL